MNNSDKDAVAYLKALTEANGVSVATVEDGWVFAFTKEKLQFLLKGLADSEKLTIFVKDSRKIQNQGPVN